MIYARICVNCMKEKPNVTGICPFCGFDAAKYHTPSHHLPLYTRLCADRYIVGKAIGSGGFGITYIAFDTRLDIPVAIKELFISGKVRREKTRTVLIDTTAGGRRQYEEIKRRFMQEAIVLAEMETIEGLVKVKDYFQENGTAYIVMEYLDGRTMKDVFQEFPRRMAVDEAVSVLTPVIEALARLHNKGVIHRDVSLDNIMLLKDGRVKLIDLGGGKRQGDGSAVSTIAIKKSAYTPLEQILGRGGEIGPQTDVYALAVTIYRCICGKYPKSAGERANDNDIEKPSKLGVKITRKQEQALLKALILDPRKRTQNVQELYEGLFDKRKIPVIPIVAAAFLLTAAIVGVVTFNVFGPDRNDGQEQEHSEERAPALAPGKITSIYNSANGVDIRWEKIPDAAGYNLYRERSADGKKKIAFIENPDTLQYFDEEVKDNCWGRVYQYYICPVYGTEEGPKSDSVTVKRMAPVEFDNLTETGSGEFQLSWISTRDQKADGYEIQYAQVKEELFEQRGSFVKISIDDGEDTSMSISGLTVGKTYYFRIRCYGSYTNSTTQKTTFSWSQYSDTEEVAVK